VDQELRPVDQLVVNGRKGFLVVRGKPDFLPPLCGQVGTLGSLEVEVQGVCGGVWTNGGVARVGERAGLSAAEACDIMFISTEGLGFRIESGRGVSTSVFGCDVDART
jgi:hypothetical protein